MMKLRWIMEKIVIKKVLTHRNKTLVIFLLTGFFLALYTTAGAISYQNGGFLPMPQFEQDIPFWTWTIWIYIVLYPAYIVWSLYSYTDEIGMNKTLFGFILLTIISCTIFILFPVSYPRGFFPLSLDNDLSTLIYRAMRAADKPSNCLPSLHVGLCFTFAYGFYNQCRKRFWVAIFISTLIGISTLTTKQHYIYDIVLGFAFATVLYYLLNKYTHFTD